MGFDSVLWLRAKADQENDGWPGPRTADFTVFTRQVDFSCSQLSRFISLHFSIMTLPRFALFKAVFGAVLFILELLVFGFQSLLHFSP
jgi:hypothetical protein